MKKPPEEGNIWEWRAFGSLSPELLARINSRPLRAGIVGKPEYDIYLISPTSDNNVKLREMGGRFVLKLKPLLEAGSIGIELYQESQDLVYGFPVDKSVFDRACSLLETAAPGDLFAIQSFGEEGFTRILSTCRPPIKRVEVSKTRSQFVVLNGWVEVADMIFPRKTTQSISVHSFEKEAISRTIEDLKVPNALKVMNYVQACRRWG